MLQALGLTIPTPILMAGTAYGVRDDLEVGVRGDATASAYGVAHVEPGVAWHPIPTVTLAGSLHLLSDFQAFRAAPLVTGVHAWRLGHHLVYAGADVAVAFGNPTRVVAGPLAGTELRLGRWGLALELKWLAPYHDVEPLAPTWISPAHHGYLSAIVGVSRYVGEVR